MIGEARRLVAYEMVNRTDPTMVERIDLPSGDYDGRVLDGLLRQMDARDWYVSSIYSVDFTSRSAGHWIGDTPT